MARGRGKQIGAGLSGEERGKGCGRRDGEADWSRTAGKSGRRGVRGCDREGEGLRNVE